MATFLIGDIQGCIDPLQRLLEKIQFDPAADRLWLCGDLVNRGGGSLETLRLILQLREQVSVTLGNHDLHLLGLDERFPDGGSNNPELEHVLQAADRNELLNWLRMQPLAAWSEEFSLLRVHAGLVPQWSAKKALKYAAEAEFVVRGEHPELSLPEMLKGKPRRWRKDRIGRKRLRLITAILTRMRFCDLQGRLLHDASGPPGSQAKGYVPWFRHPDRKSADTVIAFGHWAALGLMVEEKLICLDSACVWGGRLTALRLEDKQVFQVPGIFHRAVV